MVCFVLDLLARHSVAEAIINIHYLPEKMREFVRGWNAAGGKPHLSVQDESDLILGSGGGLRKAADWLFAREPSALVCNADVLAEPDLSALFAAHQRLRREGVGATLTVMPHPEAGRKYNGLRVRGERVVGFAQPGAPAPDLLHFPGFYVADAEAVRAIPAGRSLSVVDSLWKPLADSGRLGAFRYDGYYHDLGTVEDLRAAEEFFRGRPAP
jgi:NDP-sugar pyrophosphorylase family protein